MKKTFRTAKIKTARSGSCNGEIQKKEKDYTKRRLNSVVFDVDNDSQRERVEEVTSYMMRHDKKRTEKFLQQMHEANVRFIDLIDYVDEPKYADQMPTWNFPNTKQ